MKADVAGDVTQKEFRSFCYEDIQCYCILQFSEYCAILGVLCAHDYKKNYWLFLNAEFCRRGAI